MHAIKQLICEKKTVLIRVAAVALAVTGSVNMLSQSAFAQNTYMITDGENVTYHTTSATDPDEVLSEAGFELGMDDTYTTQESNGVSEINVQRDQVTVVTETYTETLAYETVELLDDQMAQGKTKVLTVGSDGEVQRTAQVTYVNGVETERDVLSTQVIKSPVDEVVAVGTYESNVEPGKLHIGNGVIVTPDGEVLTYNRTMQVTATAYSSQDAGCGTRTSTGTTVHWGTVAVDPSVIPYGTKMYIVSNDGSFIYGVSAAEDCGGAIKSNRVDLYMPTQSQCYAFGRRACTVYFLT